jgi:hypothetical protein
MTSHDHIVPAIEDLFRHAAAHRQTVGFAGIFSLFPEETDSTEVIMAMNRAFNNLAHQTEAIYGCLLSKKETGCPGIGFYDLMQLYRKELYAQIAGSSTHPTELTLSQMLDLATAERIRVYKHAKGELAID